MRALEGGRLALGFMATLVFIGVAATVALAAWQDWRSRKFLEALVTQAERIADSVGQHWQAKRAFPARLAELRVTPPPEAKALVYEPGSGRLSFTLSASAPGGLDGRVLLLVPMGTTDGTLGWTCRSPDIPPKLLPPRCR